MILTHVSFGWAIVLLSAGIILRDIFADDVRITLFASSRWRHDMPKTLPTFKQLNGEIDESGKRER